MLQVGLIGAGRVGRTLTKLLPREQFHVGPVIGRTPTAARRSVREMGYGTPAANVNALSDCDVVLLAVPDAAVERVVDQLVAARVPLAKSVVLQTSRLHDSKELARLRLLGATVGSLQPLFVVRRPMPSLADFCCAIEGDTKATRMARKMIRSWDGEFQLVQAEQKLHLGIACSIVADFVPGLLEMAVQQLSVAGFLKKRSLWALSRVLDSAFQEYCRAGRRARVGPLLCSEPAVVERYIERLSQHDPLAADAYRCTARMTLEILHRMSDEFAFLDHAPNPGPRVLRAAAGGGAK